MIGALRAARKAAVAAVPAAQLARLGLPALIAICALAVLVLTAGCWILGSDDRADRAAKVLGAWRGTPTGATGADPAPPGPVRRHRWMPWRRRTAA